MISMLAIEIFSKISRFLQKSPLGLTLAIITAIHAMMQVLIEIISKGSEVAPNLLKPTEVATQLRVSPGTLANWRSQGIGPRFIKLSQAANAPVRYRQDEIDEYMQGRAHGVAA